jgi:hypothetical protein
MNPRLAAKTHPALSAGSRQLILDLERALSATGRPVRSHPLRWKGSPLSGFPTRRKGRPFPAAASSAWHRSHYHVPILGAGVSLRVRGRVAAGRASCQYAAHAGIISGHARRTVHCPNTLRCGAGGPSRRNERNPNHFQAHRWPPVHGDNCPRSPRRFGMRPLTRWPHETHAAPPSGLPPVRYSAHTKVSPHESPTQRVGARLAAPTRDLNRGRVLLVWARVLGGRGAVSAAVARPSQRRRAPGTLGHRRHRAPSDLLVLTRSRTNH